MKTGFDMLVRAMSFNTVLTRVEKEKLGKFNKGKDRQMFERVESIKLKILFIFLIFLIQCFTCWNHNLMKVVESQQVEIIMKMKIIKQKIA